MASNNYTQANVVPSSDTFREWVDLTNRITYDMEKRVVTTAMHTVGGGTTGNAYVNGFFSANTLMITDSIQGVSTDDSANTLGANSSLANLSISTNVAFVNSYATITSNTTVNTFSVAEGQFVYSANSSANQVKLTTSVDEFQSNATAFNVTGTTANLDSTTTAVNGTTLDINSTTVDVDGTLLDITSTDVNVSGSNVTIDSVNVDIDGTAANLDSTTTNINGTLLDINSATVDVDSATAVNFNSPDVGINGALLDINSTTVDIDGTLLDITSTDVNVSGSNVTIDSVQLDISSNVNITSVNTTIGDAATDLLTVNANTVLTDKLNVQGAVDLDTTLNVDGNATFNADVTLGNSNGDSVNFISEVSSNIIPESNTQALGLDDSRWVLKANTINASGNVTAQADVDVAGEANVNTLRVVTDSSLEGNTTIGNLATADVVNVVARVESSIEPTANGVDLGHADRRWDLNANGVNVDNHAHFNLTMNVASVATFGNDVDISEEANTRTLRVRSTSELEGFANAQDSFGVIGNTHISGNTYIHHGDANGATTISNGNITVGSSTVNTAITPSSINTDGTLDVLGAAALSSTLGVGGATTLQDTLAVTKASTLSNTLSVAGATTLSKTLAVTGAATLSNTLSVAGATTLSKTLGVTGAATLSNTVAVTGATTLSNTLAVTGTSTLTGDVTAAGNIKAASANVSGHTNAATLGATGAVDFDSTLNVDGATTLTDTLAVTKATSLSNTLTVTGKSTLSTANVSSTLQANGAVDLNSTLDVLRATSLANTLSVAGATTLSKTLALTGAGTLSNTVSIAGAATLSNTISVAGAATLSKTLGVTGAATFSNTVGISGLTSTSNMNITGTANVSSVIHVGSANTKVRLANNDIAVGNAAANSKLTSTGISTTGTLTVGTTAAMGNTTITGDASITGDVTATHANVGGLHSTGAADLDTTLNVDGVTTLNANVALGTDINDIIDIEGSITRLRPTANGDLLGGTLRRWAGSFTTVNTSGSAVIGGGVTTGANVNITGSVIASGIANIAGNLDVGGNTDIDGTHIYLGSNSSVISNSSFTTITANKSILDELEISDSVVLPSNSVLSYAQGIIQNLDVTANAQFSTGANVVVDFGDTPTGKATVNLVNAHFTNTMALDHRLQVGTFSSGSSGTQANSSAVESENIYARGDLVAKYSSDQRLKDQVVKIDTALDKVETISGYQFTWNKHIDDYRTGTVDYGVIAQELEKILPHAVDINNRGYKTVNYNSLIPLLIEAVKELSGRVKELEKGEIDG